MDKNLSICIPAYNEEKCIGATLESALDQTFRGKKEILVGANGCTDKTSEVVRNYASRYSEIQLVEIFEKGKPNTWNILRNKAQSNLILFADGDVSLDRLAVENLYEALKGENKIAYGATNFPNLSHSSQLVRTLTLPSPSQGCLYGRLYGVNNSLLTERMKLIGFNKMPNDLILEDLWLTLVIGPENWETLNNAKIYFTPYCINEAPKMFRRQARGIRQIKENYPELLELNKSRNPLKHSDRLKRLISTPGVYHKLRACMTFIAHQTLRAYANIAIANEKLASPLEGWETSKHSKQPIRR